MITRLKVKGFKNLFDVDISFGAFTCIAGVNGVGKSNLFDAINFLSKLSDKTPLEAAFSIRESQSEKRSVEDIRSIFYNDGKKYGDRMEFEVDMIIPETGTDHLGQNAVATVTSLRYHLILSYRKETEDIPSNPIEILLEELKPISKAEIKRTLKRIGGSDAWINSVLKGHRQNARAFIETNAAEKRVIIRQDGKGGNKKELQINLLRKTVLSSSNAIENPTMLIVKKEMESWQLLQLEPSSLRSPDDLVFSESPKVQTDGRHLPATLYRLINDKRIKIDCKAEIANRLSELIDDVFEVDVEKDNKRDILTLMVKSKGGQFMPAKSLSDGTLRFLALSIIEIDPEMQGVICLEEPENGIHPSRIPAILKLLKDISVDIGFNVATDNPLRQVIINTHSPLVVSEVPEDSLIYADVRKIKTENKDYRTVTFMPLPRTWRAKENPKQETIVKGMLIEYLNPYRFKNDNDENEFRPLGRVIDRQELKQLSLFQ